MGPDVLEDLFKKYYSQAVLYIYSMGRDYALAEDIASTAFFKAFTTLPEADARFKFWLLKVCKNAYIDAVRKRRDTAIYEEVCETLPDGTDVVQQLIAQEEYQALYRAVSLLDEAYREAIELYYFQDLSVAEIAELSGKSESLVKVNLYRARNKLKTLLEGSYGI